MNTSEHHNLLSRRENQVMECVLQGMSNKLIARKLFLTERTIKFHCSNIYRKLDINNRASLILLMQQGFEGESQRQSERLM